MWYNVHVLYKTTDNTDHTTLTLSCSQWQLHCVCHDSSWAKHINCDLQAYSHASQYSFTLFLHTIGDDFNATAFTFTLDGQSSLVEKTARINIVDDIMSEYEEIFVLVLKVVNATEGIDIDITRNVSVARIRQDSDGKYLCTAEQGENREVIS